MSALLTLVLPFALIVVLVGGMLFWLPRLTRPDIYFAVTVPPDFRDSVEGRAILGRYRAFSLLSSLLALALVIGAAARWPLALIAALLIQEGGSIVAYLSGRQRVLPHAVAPVSVREAALEARPARLAGGWRLQAIPFILLAGAGLYLNQHWADIPARFPIHWGLDGQPDGWAFRTPAGVYGPLIEGGLVCLMMAGLAYALTRWTRPVRIGGTSGEAESHFRRTVTLVLVSTEYLMSIMFALTSLMPLRPGPPPIAVLVGLPLVFALIVVAVLVRQGQGGSRMAQVASGASADASPARPVGDRTADRFWKAGLFYVNRDDPALFIEKRFGVGYTINFGRPGSWVILGLIVLIPLVIAVAARLATK